MKEAENLVKSLAKCCVWVRVRKEIYPFISSWKPPTLAIGTEDETLILWKVKNLSKKDQIKTNKKLAIHFDGDLSILTTEDLFSALENWEPQPFSGRM